MNKLDWQTPDELYPGLFEEVQKNGVYADSKTFCDLVPKANPQAILKAWQQQRTHADFDLQAFLDHSFFHPASPTASFQSRPEEGVTAHISRLWPCLSREVDSDLVVVAEWSPFLIFRREGAQFTKEELAGTEGLWKSVVSWDYNGDGTLDLLGILVRIQS